MPAVEALETKRLILRPRTAGDAALRRRLWTERDPRVPPHRRIDADGRPSVEDLAERLRAEQARPGPRLLMVVLKDSGAGIGYCGLNPRDRTPDEADLAYELLQSAQGHGYATEAAVAVVTRARQAGFHRLWAGVRDWNLASRRVLEKVGFHQLDEVEPDPVHGDLLMTVLDLSAGAEVRTAGGSSTRRRGRSPTDPR